MGLNDFGSMWDIDHKAAAGRPVYPFHENPYRN